MISLSRLCALAHDRLPSDLADRFCNLLEPQAQILSAAHPGDEQVGVLGGEPLLPEAVGWPVWEGHGPLSFVASLDCGRLSAVETGLALPTAGTLLFFYFDGQADDYQWMGNFDPNTRVLYVPAGTPVQPRPAPSPLEPYRQVPLRAEPAVERPEITSPRLYERLGLDDETVITDPAFAEFDKAVWDLLRLCHQVGGSPQEIQGDVGFEVADFPPDWDLDDLTPNNPHFKEIFAEAYRYQLLLQIDSDKDAGMEWGDGGALYWLITPEDLAAHRFDQTRFTWQCH